MSAQVATAPEAAMVRYPSVSRPLRNTGRIRRWKVRRLIGGFGKAAAAKVAPAMQAIANPVIRRAPYGAPPGGGSHRFGGRAATPPPNLYCLLPLQPAVPLPSCGLSSERSLTRRPRRRERELDRCGDCRSSASGTARLPAHCAVLDRGAFLTGPALSPDGADTDIMTTTVRTDHLDDEEHRVPSRRPRNFFRSRPCGRACAQRRRQSRNFGNKPTMSIAA